MHAVLLLLGMFQRKIIVRGEQVGSVGNLDSVDEEEEKDKA